MDGKKVEIAKLPDEDIECPEGKDLIVSGWGRTWKEDLPDPVPSSYLPLVLKAIRLDCADPAIRCPTWPKEANILCLGHPTILSNSACFEDSGGRKNAMFINQQLLIS